MMAVPGSHGPEVDELRSPLAWLRASLAARDDRRNIKALARHLGIAPEDARWLYRRSREVGYPTALKEFGARPPGSADRGSRSAP